MLKILAADPCRQITSIEVQAHFIHTNVRNPCVHRIHTHTHINRPIARSPRTFASGNIQSTTSKPDSLISAQLELFAYLIRDVFFQLFARALSLSRSHGALTMIQLLHASQTDEEPNGHEIRVNLSFVMNWIDINGNDAISSWIHYTLKQHPNTQLSRLCVRIDCWCGFSFCLSTENACITTDQLIIYIWLLIFIFQ